jgi:hypothetical protein
VRTKLFYAIEDDKIKDEKKKKEQAIRNNECAIYCIELLKKNVFG